MADSMQEQRTKDVENVGNDDVTSSAELMMKREEEQSQEEGPRQSSSSSSGAAVSSVNDTQEESHHVNRSSNNNSLGCGAANTPPSPSTTAKNTTTSSSSALGFTSIADDADSILPAAPGYLLHALMDAYTTATARIVAIVEGFIAGGVAGAVSKTVIAPGDRVKIIYQVDPERKFSLGKALKTGNRIVERGGVGALWTGNTATMMRVVPHASIMFVSFDTFHQFLDRLLNVNSQQRLQPAAAGAGGPGGAVDQTAALTSRFTAGAMAGASATSVTYPLDLMRARFAAHWDPLHPRYPSYSGALREIINLEGWRALYSGLWPTLVGVMPYAGSAFACFETFKFYLVQAQIHKGVTSEKELPTYQRLCAGAVAGLIGQTVTYPLDIVRRRMQVRSAQESRYRSIRHALTTIYKEEGLRQGLYKGLSMNWIKGPISVATSFTVNDLVKKRMRVYHTSVVSEGDGNRALAGGGCGTGRGVTFSEAALCGGVAGGAAKLWTTPFDRLKIMYAAGLATADEHNLSHNGQAVRLMRDMLRETPNMWQGSGAMMVRVIPYAAFTYAFFEPCQRLSQRVLYTHETNFATNFCAGAVSAVLASLLLYPLDLLHTRSAIHQGTSARPWGEPRYASVIYGLREVARREGGIRRGLYSGASAAVVGIAPMAGIGFAVYHKILADYCNNPQSNNSNSNHTTVVPFWQRLGAGCVAGVVAQSATYPLNVVRRRAQVEEVVYEGVARSLKEMYVAKGFYSGMYQRMPFGWVMGAMTVGLSFSINDACRDALKALKRDLRRISTTNTKQAES